MDPAVEILVCGEDGIEEAQEGEGGAGHSRRVGGGSEALNPIQGGGGGEPLKLRPAIHRGGRLGQIRTEGRRERRRWRGQRKGHCGSVGQPDENNNAQEADGEQGRAGGKEGG